MFFTYILYSNKIDKYYIGATENLEQRLSKHNSNHKGFTGRANDWEIVYYEEYGEKTEALKREKEIKNWKSRKKIKEIIG